MQLRIVIAPGERDDVDGCTDPGSFENVWGSVDFAQIDRDVAREAYDVAWWALVPADGCAAGSLGARSCPVR